MLYGVIRLNQSVAHLMMYGLDVGTFDVGGLISVVFYSSTQTVTIPTGATKAIASAAGGGGGGGGTAGGVSGFGGGGGGGALIKFLSGLTQGNTLSLTVGAGGTGGSSTGTAGSSGGNTVLASGTQTITTLTAGGGGAGLGYYNKEE